jgi:hypothetical protein
MPLCSCLAGRHSRTHRLQSRRPRLLLTQAIPVPEPGDIPRHERFYYLELLRRAGMIEGFPESGHPPGRHRRGARPARPTSRGWASPARHRHQPRRGLRQRQALAARALRGRGAKPRAAAVLLFGSAGERELCETVAESLRRTRGIDARNLAGETTLREFIDLAAACRLFLTNDSGAMHVASALGVPTVAVFGATDDTTTGPTGPLARVVREHAECSPCLLRECPIDHRCMTAVTVERTAAVALGPVEGDRLRVDTRTKILTAAGLAALDPPRPLLLAAPLRRPAGGMVRELAAARRRTGANSLVAVVRPLPDELAPLAARAEMAAALRVVDYVFIAENGDLSSLPLLCNRLKS